VTNYYIEICALLGCYVAWSGNSLPTFRDNLSGANFKCQRIPYISDKIQAQIIVVSRT